MRKHHSKTNDAWYVIKYSTSKYRWLVWCRFLHFHVIKCCMQWNMVFNVLLLLMQRISDHFEICYTADRGEIYNYIWAYWFFFIILLLKLFTSLYWLLRWQYFNNSHRKQILLIERNRRKQIYSILPTLLGNIRKLNVTFWSNIILAPQCIYIFFVCVWLKITGIWMIFILCTTP